MKKDYYIQTTRKRDLMYYHWTKSAIECYEIGCRCSICKLRRIIESKCVMKETVITIVRNIGKPPKGGIVRRKRNEQ